MKRHFLILMLLLTGLSNSFCIFSSQDRGKVIRIKNLDPDNEVGRQYLVLIAINRYEHWRGLTGAVKDGIEIRDILQSRYYFDKIFELYDDQATRVAIVMLLEQLQKELNPEDSVFVWSTQANRPPGGGYLFASFKDCPIARFLQTTYFR